VRAGDLVRCPAYNTGAAVQKSYIGLVIGVYGHKAEILGGPQVRETWDLSDLRLIDTSKAPPAPGWTHESR
jgi:hypothetical protein